MTSPTVNPLAAATTQASSLIPQNMQISETGFLQLITTQLQSQDPLNPANPTQFLSQIEGLSEVSSLQNMQSTLQTQQLTNGAALLGQSVLAPVSTAALTTGGTVTGAINAPAGTSALNVTIADGTGNTVSSFQVTPRSSGLTPFSWNGQTSAGTPAPAGDYTVSVGATVGGATQSLTPLISSQVTSVSMDPSTQAIDVTTTNGTVPLSTIAGVL